MAEMTRLGILEDDDLRTDKERAQAPDRLPEGVRDNAREVLSEEDFKQHPRFYPSFVSSERARGAVAQVLKDIENESGAMLYHCSAGQDRTGWVTAVLLTLLGVPRETVDADYLLSNAFHEAAGSSERVDMPELDSAFAEMDRMYGSFDNFVHDGLGLTEDDIAGLNARLLE
jgi:protein-tyrosine phosphatase